MSWNLAKFEKNIYIGMVLNFKIVQSYKKCWYLEKTTNKAKFNECKNAIAY